MLVVEEYNTEELVWLQQKHQGCLDTVEMMQEKNTLTVLKLITEDITFKNKKIMENTQELVDGIKEQLLLIE